MWIETRLITDRVINTADGLLRGRRYSDDDASVLHLLPSSTCGGSVKFGLRLTDFSRQFRNLNLRTAILQTRR